MSQGAAARSIRTPSISRQDAPRLTNGSSVPAASETRDRHTIFKVLWHSTNVLLILAIFAAAYSGVWEYSTRRYLRGFSDAIVPESSSTEQKMAAILQWMSNGPARLDSDPRTAGQDRNPTDTLNYASLLQVCGSATNAFINLADSAGMPARRLLLLDSHRLTKHVVAEVYVDGRWAVVDPAYRVILLAPDGQLLTREELSNPAVWAAATRGIAGYSPAYTFDRTAHIRIARMPFVGGAIRTVLDHVLPGWEDSVTLSLMLERESLAALVIAVAFLIVFGLFRLGLRWYGERRLGVRPIRFRQQVRRAFQAFVDTAA